MRQGRLLQRSLLTHSVACDCFGSWWGLGEGIAGFGGSGVGGRGMLRATGASALELGQFREQAA